jgi:hypothetical protein
MTMLETIKKSVDTHSIVKYKGQSIDAYSASAIIAVHTALKPEAQKTYEAIIEKNVLRAASIAFKLCK